MAPSASDLIPFKWTDSAVHATQASSLTHVQHHSAIPQLQTSESDSVLVSTVNFIRDKGGDSVHWTAQPGTPLLSVPPPISTNLFLFNPISGRWVDGAPDLNLASERPPSDWVSFHYGDGLRNEMFLFDHVRNSLTDFGAGSPLWKGNAIFTRWVNRSLAQRELTDDALDAHTGDWFNSEEESHPYDPLSFCICENVIVYVKSLMLQTDETLLLHYMSAFRLHEQSSAQDSDDTPIELWHKMFFSNCKVLHFALRVDFVTVELTGADGTVRFVVLDTGTGAVMHVTTFSRDSSFVCPTLAREPLGNDTKLRMPQSKSHVFHINDGKLWVWSLPKINLVVAGVCMSILQHLVTSKRWTVSEDGAIISFIDGQKDLTVIDVRRKTVEVHRFEGTNQTGQWWVTYRKRTGAGEPVDKVSMMTSRLYPGYGV
ncbi:hypothetical protein HDU97_005353 [Phlyctochytrium planicorne]|nr:hypothetical protein HDU97_005353 [Phlyctochytrium planicorne]